jgi:hypothetical protein|tara:strand:+ start:1291 stop:1635 length:345 start_codon:yes stop_codon:yes gene_type:complete
LSATAADTLPLGSRFVNLLFFPPVLSALLWEVPCTTSNKLAFSPPTAPPKFYPGTDSPIPPPALLPDPLNPPDLDPPPALDPPALDPLLYPASLKFLCNAAPKVDLISLLPALT